MLLVETELHRLGIEGQHPMDSFGLLSGHLGEPLRCPSSRGSQQDGLAHRAPQVHNGFGCEGLTAPGSSGQHQQVRGDGQFDRLTLFLRKGDVPLLCVAINPALHTWEIDCNWHFGKDSHASGQSLLCVEERRRVAQALFCEVTVAQLGDKLPVLGHLCDEFADACRVCGRVWQRQPLDDALGQFPLRQKAVTLLGCLLQHVEHPCLVAEVGIGGDADVSRDRVGSDETNAENIGGQLIRVLRDHLDRLIAVLFVNLHGIGSRDVVAAQKQHDLRNRLLRRPCLFDHGHALFANAGDLDQARAFLFNDVERLQTEMGHDAPGRYRADALNQPAAQVLFYSGECCWFGFLHVGALELPSVLEVLAPVPGEA